MSFVGDVAVRGFTSCHIIPRSLGGEGKPSNFVILCKQCHEDSPDVADPEIIWDWIKAYHTSSYDTFWILQGVKEYSFIYKRTIAEDFMSLGIVDEQGCKTLLSNALKESMWKSITHFGHVRPCAATVAGVLRMALKTIAKEKSIDLPDGRSAENQGVIW